LIAPLVWSLLPIGSLLLLVDVFPSASGGYVVGLVVALGQTVRLVFSPNADMEADFADAFHAYLKKEPGASTNQVSEPHDGQKMPGANAFAGLPALQESVDFDNGRIASESLRKISAETLAKQGEGAPIVKLVNALLMGAVEKGASNIYIEPFKEELSVRYRIHNSLYRIMSPPLKFRDAITARIKKMSKLDVKEQRCPQQGLIRVRFRNNGVTTDVDLSVSCLPSSFGENILISIPTHPMRRS
jgi:type IV pilus assembly protein PilB